MDVNGINKSMLLFTRIQGDRFIDHALDPFTIQWTAVTKFKLACSSEFLAIVGGADMEGRATKIIQVARMSNLSQKLSDDSLLMLRTARIMPSVAFGRTNPA